MSGTLRRALRAFPTLLKIGFAEAVAYRAEFIVWMLSTTLPLVNLALWTAVAREAPDGQFGRWGQSDFVAYFLAALIVRNLTGTWVTWELNQDIRAGTLSLRLLRPVHPFVAYAAEHLAAIPMRALIALPVAIILLVTTGGGHVVSDPLLIALLPLSLLGAWAVNFVFQLVIGCLALFLERSTAIFEVWLGLWAVLSGYLVPLELMPWWLRDAAMWLPFRGMVGAPVELMTGLASRETALFDLAVQWGWVAVALVMLRLVWTSGLRRFEAYGG
jgi:ABC-2 type transport system permease protein